MEKCLVLGYDKDNSWHLSEEPRKIILSLKASEGLIKTTYAVERPYPLFRISAEVRGGLSGGPVLNERGEVVGIVSSGMEFTQGEEPVSWISHSSALLNIKVQTVFFGQVKSEVIGEEYRITLPLSVT